MARAKKIMEATADPLDAMLARLQLSGIRDQLDTLLDEAARANLSARETLILLCEREIARKDHRRIEMALKLAHFPAVKELAGFDFEAQPSIDPKQIRDLAASRWIANGENVLLLGPPESDSYCPPRYAIIVQALFGGDRQTTGAGSAAPARRS
ncbi:DNA replication protein DnaC [Bradyrhizobium sp. USDA 4472]